MPGPAPKRSDERIRRNKPATNVDKFDLDGTVEIPNAFFFNTYVNDIWISLKESAHAQFYEPTDWAYAKFVLKMIDDQIGDGDKFQHLSAVMWSTIKDMMGQLLLTEADRRRVHIEVTRNGAKAQGEEGQVVSAADRFRDRFEQQREA